MAIACLAGYVWLYIGITHKRSDKKTVEVCLIKHTTNIPCPSCGSTRSVISIIKGDFLGSLYINPLGYVIAFIMFLTPPWILYDVITKKRTLIDFYFKIEFYLKKPKIAIPLIILIVLNWIWNITKEL